MKYIKYLFRFLLIVGISVLTLYGAYSGITSKIQEQTSVVVTDKYTEQYRGTVTNYISVCRFDNKCTNISVRKLDSYTLGNSYIFFLDETRFHSGGIIFYHAISVSLLLVTLIFIVGYFIYWCFKD